MAREGVSQIVDVHALEPGRLGDFPPQLLHVLQVLALLARKQIITRRGFPHATQQIQRWRVQWDVVDSVLLDEVRRLAPGALFEIELVPGGR